MLLLLLLHLRVYREPWLGAGLQAMVCCPLPWRSPFLMPWPATGLSGLWTKLQTVAVVVVTALPVTVSPSFLWIFVDVSYPPVSLAGSVLSFSDLSVLPGPHHSPPSSGLSQVCARRGGPTLPRLVEAHHVGHSIFFLRTLLCLLGSPLPSFLLKVQKKHHISVYSALWSGSRVKAKKAPPVPWRDLRPLRPCSPSEAAPSLVFSVFPRAQEVSPRSCMASSATGSCARRCRGLWYLPQGRSWWGCSFSPGALCFLPSFPA